MLLTEPASLIPDHIEAGHLGTAFMFALAIVNLLLALAALRDMAACDHVMEAVRARTPLDVRLLIVGI